MTSGGDAREFKVAFDRGGVLDSSERMCRLATLLSAATECYCISAVGAQEGETVADCTARYMRNHGWIARELYKRVPNLSGVYFTPVYRKENDEQRSYEAGIFKARLMQALRVDVLFDNDEHVCRAVRDHGLTALLLLE